MSAPSDPKARITSHMNKEHSSELKQYLQAFNNLTARQASNAQLIDLSLDTLTIKSASGTHQVRVSPPMKSLADARVRLVDMASEAQAKLGLGGVRVTTLQAPAGAGLVSFVGISFYFFSYVALATGYLAPSTAAWEALNQYWPFNGAKGFAWLVRAIFWPVLAIHVAEAGWMAYSRLPKYGIPVGSLLWIGWVSQTFFEGYPAMLQFDALVAKAKADKEGAKH
ncbi:hypothetical protein F5Y16DRAFT_339823 [Xylariaceae sp. FL0255]|nr:hypothetical protein F5Y16DRAFT_339823 [Xylariaceae sp. FL0255]